MDRTYQVRLAQTHELHLLSAIEVSAQQKESAMGLPIAERLLMILKF